ncbi:hypothetical protein LUZ60_000985 [Juncus effusus]|nr:hypothetical protein LUZ60_000985 [Juncus effusus]
MYARTLRCKSQRWDLLFNQFRDKSKSLQRSMSHLHSSPRVVLAMNHQTVSTKLSFSPHLLPNRYQTGTSNRYSYRLYSSKGDGKQVQDSGDKTKAVKEVVNGKVFTTEHARLGELDQQEWLSGEKYMIDSKKKESPFLTKRERFKNEFLRRVIPWEKINLSLANFPYYVNENAKNCLVECVASHLRHKSFAAAYGSRLASSGGRILLRSLPGTELYRERLVKGLARELQVPLLILDSSVLAPYDFGQEGASEGETDSEEHGGASESEMEGAESGSGNEEDWTSSNEGGKTSESDDDDDPARASAQVAVAAAHALQKLVDGPSSVQHFAKRVDGESTSAETADSPPKKILKEGDRVKYAGPSVVFEVDQRIPLGKIPTPDGSTNAYTIITKRTLSNGASGEVIQINGEQVAVSFDSTGDNLEEGSKSEDTTKDGNADSSVYWVDIQDIEHDTGADWYIAIQALCEVLPTLEPVIVYFPDSSKWLAKAVPQSNRKEFVQKLGEMLDQLTGPIVLICGQNVVESASKEKEKFTMVLPQLSRIARLPLPLRKLTEGLRGNKSSKTDNIWNLFTNQLFLPLPKEDEQARTFNNQIDEDRKIIISRHNLMELHKVLEENELSCMDLLHVKSDGLFLTRKKAENVVGLARNNYLSSVNLPYVKGDRLTIPRESLDIAIERLREQETITKKPNLKSLAKDEYESNFISAVVPPEEIGVKFDDIGALEDVKTTLDELVTLPMRRPELFSRGNLLRPCKGILLFGPPGTGKTLLAKALATEAGANFISITGSTLTSKWFGDAEKLTKALFSFASRLAPVIIFVDEVDSLLGARGGGYEHEATRKMRNEFMASWDGLRSKDTQRILVLGATNRPFDLDDAVIRRLPRRIYVDLPDAQNRMKILKIFLSKENLVSDFNYQELANATEGYSGSDLKNLCIAAAYRPVQELLEEEKNAGGVTSSKPALRSLKVNDFIQAKTKVSPSVPYDATSMNELRKWNDQYGEGGSRSRTPFGFGH